MGVHVVFTDLVLPLDAVRRQVKCPCQDEGYRKPESEQQDHQPGGPVRNLEDREDNRRDLKYEPAHDNVNGRDLEDVPLF